VTYPEQQISTYYDRKHDDYLRKYGNGPFTHVHTGLYQRSRFGALYEAPDLRALGMTALSFFLKAG